MLDHDQHQPVKRKRATPECDPPGITDRVCDGLSRRRSNPSASNPHRQFGAFPHASKNSSNGARRTLACASEPRLHFTLNHYIIMPDEFNPQVVIEAKIAEDDGTARDKITRVQHLAHLSAQGQVSGSYKYEVIAC